jgi:hypothetical protein
MGEGIGQEMRGWQESAFVTNCRPRAESDGEREIGLEGAARVPKKTGEIGVFPSHNHAAR